MMQSDIVKVILNLAYLPLSLAKTFTFDKDFYKRAKNHSHHDDDQKEVSGYSGHTINN